MTLDRLLFGQLGCRRGVQCKACLLVDGLALPESGQTAGDEQYEGGHRLCVYTTLSADNIVFKM